MARMKSEGDSSAEIMAMRAKGCWSISKNWHRFSSINVILHKSNHDVFRDWSSFTSTVDGYTHYIICMNM